MKIEFRIWDMPAALASKRKRTHRLSGSFSFNITYGKKLMFAAKNNGALRIGILRENTQLAFDMGTIILFCNFELYILTQKQKFSCLPRQLQFLQSLVFIFSGPKRELISAVYQDYFKTQRLSGTSQHILTCQLRSKIFNKSKT